MKKTTGTTKGGEATSEADLEPRFAPVVEAFAKDPDVSHGGKGFGSTGLKVNGKLFAMPVEGKLVVKLPKARVDELVSAGRGKHFDPGHGRLMKEWVAVAPGEVDWIALAREAYRFVKAGRA